MTASSGGSVALWTLYGCGCYVVWCGADLPEMVQIRRDSPALMRVSYWPVSPGRHPASANNSTCGIWHTCAAWKTTHFKNNCCLHRRARRKSANWKRLANDYNIDESQLRRTLFDKKAVNKLLQGTHGER